MESIPEYNESATKVHKKKKENGTVTLRTGYEESEHNEVKVNNPTIWRLGMIGVWLGNRDRTSQ